jgi:hypothetical protein
MVIWMPMLDEIGQHRTCLGAISGLGETEPVYGIEKARYLT